MRKERMQSKRSRNTKGGIKPSYPKDKDEIRDREDFGRERDRKWDRTTNDPTWYAQDKRLLEDSANMYFSWAVGTPFSLDNEAAGVSENLVLPGICAIYTAPSLGYSADKSSPVNVAATALYSYVRSANAGSSNYDAPDLMLYCLALGQVYSYINFLQRTYGLLTLYAQPNRYIPRDVLIACDVDPDSAEGDLANFRYGINLLINKVASFSVPGNLEYFKRMAFMYSNVYTAGTSIKDQLYMYSPAGFWKFTLSDTNKSGMLDYTPFLDAQADLYTVKDLLNYGNDLLTNILGNEDFNIMSGDINKKYGNDLITLTSLPEYYPIVPIFDIAVLEQMKNATICAAFEGTTRLAGVMASSLDVTQDVSIGKGALIHEPAINSNTTRDEIKNVIMPTVCEGKVLTTTTDKTDSSLVIESSRLMAVGYGVADTNGNINLYTGSEVVTECRLFLRQYNGLVYSDTTYYRVGYVYNGSTAAAAILPNIVAQRYFRFMPQVHWVAATTSAVDDYGLFTDIDNYQILTRQEIQRLHETALMSLFHVPYVAKSIL